MSSQRLEAHELVTRSWPAPKRTSMPSSRSSRRSLAVRRRRDRAATPRIAGVSACDQARGSADSRPAANSAGSSVGGVGAVTSEVVDRLAGEHVEHATVAVDHPELAVGALVGGDRRRSRISIGRRAGSGW